MTSGSGPSAAGAALVGLAIALAGCAGSAPTPTAPSASASSPTQTPTAEPVATLAPASTEVPSPVPTPAVPSSGAWAKSEIESPRPSPREDHTWTVDADGRDAWLFGGRDGGTVYDDVWAFRLEENAWRRIRVDGESPAGRFGHEAAWVPGLGLVVFGGQAGSRFFDDLWFFTPDPGAASGSWRLLPAGGGAPVARYGSCSGLGPDGRFWISHGFTEDGVRFADTLAYDFRTLAWSDQAPPTVRPIERCLHACWWTTGGQFALYGGQTTGVAALGDLWLLTPGTGGASTNAWAEAPGQAPAPRQLAAIARLGSATLLFGGRGLDRAALGETWIAVDGTAAFEPFPTTGDEPPARSGATLIADAASGRLLLFGGRGADELADMWALTFP